MPRSNNPTRPYKCDVQDCGKDHANLRLYQCTYPGCSKRYNGSHSLSSHKLSYTKPFVCEYSGCGNRYASRISRKKHVRFQCHQLQYQLQEIGNSADQKEPVVTDQMTPQEPPSPQPASTCLGPLSALTPFAEQVPPLAQEGGCPLSTLRTLAPAPCLTPPPDRFFPDHDKTATHSLHAPNAVKQPQVEEDEAATAQPQAPMMQAVAAIQQPVLDCEYQQQQQQQQQQQHTQPWLQNHQQQLDVQPWDRAGLPWSAVTCPFCVGLSFGYDVVKTQGV